MEQRQPPLPLFIIDGQEHHWAVRSSVPPAPVQRVLDEWVNGEPISQYVAHLNRLSRIKLIGRIERTTGKQASTAQLEDLKMTRKELEIYMKPSR